MHSTLQEDLIGKYLSGELSAGEKGSLMSWVEASPENRTVFDEMIHLWSITEEEPEFDFPVHLPNAWSALDSRIDSQPKEVDLQTSPARPMPQLITHSRYRRLNWAWSAAAAVVVLIVASWWIFLREKTPETLEFSTQVNESRRITLPDNSSIVLNENSTLRYTQDGDTRNVVLSGEAFFEVTKDPDHPFVIQSGQVQTKVLGTSFNVRAYPDEARVKISVKTGRVEVSKRATNPSEIPLQLLPGNTGVYEAKSETLEKAQDVATEDVDSWQEGTLVFPFGTKLSEVIPAVAKLYDINITVTDPKILNCPLNGRFYRKNSIEESLKYITEPITCTYALEGEVYVISGPGCN